MRSSAVVLGSLVVAAALVIGASWSWFARDESPAPIEAGEGSKADGARYERSSGSKQEHSARQPGRANPSRTRPSSAAGNTSSDSDDARSGSAGRIEATPEVQKLASGIQAPAAEADAEEPDDVFDEGETDPEGDEFDQFRRRLDELRGNSRSGLGGDPLELDVAGLEPGDMDFLDLNDDGAISASEIEKSARLAERAERHPRRNDLGDHKYPVERDEYRRPDWEFDAVDANQDDVIEEDEVYSYFVKSEKVSLGLDADGDKNINREESGLSEDDFAHLDFDSSGVLEDREIREGVAQGAFD